MGKKRKKKHDETHVDETWLIPYADMLTLLLALFIVLFAASNVDEGKFLQISETFEEIFTGGDDLLEYPEVIEKSPNDPTDNSPMPNDQDKKEKEKEDNQTDEKEDEDKNKELDKDKEKEKDKEKDQDSTIEVLQQKDMEKLNALKEQMDKYFVSKGLDVMIDTKLMKEGLLIAFHDGVLFASGSAEVTYEAKILAREVSEFLVAEPPREIRIAGHTDDRPINTPEFPSNWELSAARSINFMKILLQNTKLDAERFSASAYGEFRPVATNSTAKGRAKNRRIEILILPYDYSNNEE